MAGKLCWALGLVLLFAAAVLTQAPLAVGLLGFFLLLTLLLVLEVRYLRGKVEAELIVPDQPAVQGRPFVLTVRLTNHSPLPIPQLLTLVQATDEWGGNTITLRCSGMLGSKARAEQRLTLQANKSGVWQLRLQSVTLWDHLGLFKAQCGLPQTAQSLCVLPQSARLGSDTQPDPRRRRHARERPQCAGRQLRCARVPRRGLAETSPLEVECQAEPAVDP